MSAFVNSGAAVSQADGRKVSASDLTAGMKPKRISAHRQSQASNALSIAKKRNSTGATRQHRRESYTVKIWVRKATLPESAVVIDQTFTIEGDRAGSQMATPHPARR